MFPMVQSLQSARHSVARSTFRTVVRSLVVTTVAGLALLLAAPAYAQSSTTGGIAGTITDNGGALLPKATVMVTNAATGVTRKTTGSDKGEYRVSELEPGVYSVAISADGFSTYQADLVTVTVGSISNVSPKLTVGSTSEKVEVTDEAPSINLADNAITTTIDQDRIDNLPINGRRFSSFALLTPGVVSNSDGFGLLSFRGISFLLNNSEVDGMDNNQAYFSEERGRTRASYSISQAAVQEFQVNTSNYSAEYGRAAGGVINTITKSGTNEFHGEVFFYDRDNDFGASNPYTQQIVQQAGTNNFLAQNYKPKDVRKQFGFGLGGPLLRDKLFFFYSYDQSQRIFPGTARASDPSDTFAPADTALPTGTTCTNAAAQYLARSAAEGDQFACALQTALGTAAVPTYAAAAAYYSQGLGIIAGELGYVPRVADQVLNLPKIDWQINDRNRLSVDYNRLRFSSPAGVQTQASNFYGRASFGNDFVKEDFSILRFTSVLTNNLVNQFRAQYGRDFEYGTDQNPLPNELPLSGNQFAHPADIGIAYEFDLSGFDVGTPESQPRGALPDERRVELADGVTYSHGSHTVKAGVDVNRVYDRIDNLYAGNGDYSYDYQWDFISDYLHATTGLGGTGYADNYYSFSQGFYNGKMSDSTTDYGFYVNDEWRVSPKLTLTLGARYEYEYIPPIPTALINTNLTEGGKQLGTQRPSDRNNIGPRVGFAYNVYGDGNTVIKGGYGLYYGRVINSNILQAYQNGGSPNGTLSLGTYEYTSATATNPHGGCSNLFPNIFPTQVNSTTLAQLNAFGCQTPGGVAYSTTAINGGPSSFQQFLTNPSSYNLFSAPTVAFLDPHVQNPQVHEADLSVEQNLGYKTVLSVTYLGSFGRELPSVFDANSPTTVSTSTFTVNNTLATTIGGGVTGTVLPRGGKKPPLQNGSVHTYKQYTGTRPNPSYYSIYDVGSEVTSAYNALAVQLNKRFTNDLSVLTNFTWAHGLDYNPYLSTVYGSSSYLPLDPGDPKRRQDYGNSNLNVNKRFVFAAHYNPRFNVHGYKEVLVDGWGISPIVTAQTGLPYSATTSGTQNGASLSNILGSGGAARLPKFDAAGNLENERNSFNYPKIAELDLRIGKNFYETNRFGRFRLEVFAEAFNLLNHQNITSVSTGSYTICTKASSNPLIAGGCPSTTYPAGQGLLVFNSNFGTYKNANSNTVYTPRQVQIAARLHF
jgi:hypothetical protein